MVVVKNQLRSRLQLALGILAVISVTGQASAEPKSKTLRPDKEQPWFKADDISVKTVGGAPVLEIRYSNAHESREVEGIEALGSGNARDNLGHSFNVFTHEMPDTLEPQESIKMTYRFLPKTITESTAVLFVAEPLEERAVFVELGQNNGTWKLVEYGVWKKERAYFDQNDWVSKRLKENPFNKAAAAPRLWRDNSGNFSVQASFVDFEINRRTGKTMVSLKRQEDGETIKIPNDRLSDEDQRYIRALMKKKREKKEDSPQKKLQDLIREKTQKKKRKRT